MLNIIWHHPVLEETAIGISDAFTLMGIDHDCRQNKTKVIIDKNNDHIYIIVGIHHFTKLPLNYIIIQTEQPGSNWITPDLFHKFEMSMGLWEFSPKLNKEWLSLGYNSSYVPIRIPMSPFVDIGNNDIHFTSIKKDIDVLFYGGRHARRSIIEGKLKKQLHRKNIIFRYYDLFGEEREYLISRSKIVINIHFWPKSSLETHRIEYLMARGKCVISERSLDKELDIEYSKAVIFTTYDNIIETVKNVLNQPSKMKEHETKARKLSETHQFNMDFLKNALLNSYKKEILK